GTRGAPLQRGANPRSARIATTAWLAAPGSCENSVALARPMWWRLLRCDKPPAPAGATNWQRHAGGHAGRAAPKPRPSAQREDRHHCLAGRTRIMRNWRRTRTPNVVAFVALRQPARASGRNELAKTRGRARGARRSNAARILAARGLPPLPGWPHRDCAE